MPLSGLSSVINEDYIYHGQWEALYGMKSGIRHEFGVVRDGALRVGREVEQFFGTNNPNLLEVEIPTRTSVSFAGTAHELRAGLLHFLVGDAAIDDPSMYVYPSATCAFGDIDLTVVGERTNCPDNMVVFTIFQGRASGAIEIGSADGFIGTPIEINALADQNGAFGGTPTHPYGWIWLTQA